MKRFCICILLGIFFLLSGCAPAPPRNQTNLCSIFFEYPKWYWATQRTQKKWGVPISVQMAIMHQESHFRADAKPPRTKLLWVIPWTRPTTAEGYAQAVDDTWRIYLRSTRVGVADRADFASAADFISWFSYRAHRRLGISRNNAYALYLAYHEGTIGYQQRTFERKPWLKHVAQKVQRTANHYHAQLQNCQSRLPQHHWWNIFS